MKIFINDIPLSVKLADTEIKQAKGLQNTPNLSQNSGMLFCYPHEKKVSFWMKETTIPLSIAFIDKNKLIVASENPNNLKVTSLQLG